MKVRTLIFCGDAWHPAEDVRRGLSALGDERFDFDFVTATANGWWEIMRDFAVIIPVGRSGIPAGRCSERRSLAVTLFPE